MAAASDTAKKTGAVKDMKSVIAQLEQVKKGNAGLNPVAGSKPKPLLSTKPTIGEQTEPNGDFRPVHRSTTDRQVSSAAKETSMSDRPKPSEVSNPFKVVLKPVSQSSGNDTRKSVTEAEKPGKADNDQKTALSSKSSTSVANKSKMFETKQKQAEEDKTNTSSANAPALMPKSPAISNFPKSTVASKPQANQTTSAADTTLKPTNKNFPPPIKGTTEIKPELDNSSLCKSDVQGTAKKSGNKTNELEDKWGNKNTSTLRPAAAAKVPQPSNINSTLPKSVKLASLSTTTSKTEKEMETTHDKDSDEINQPKLPSKSPWKADQPKITSKANEKVNQIKIPPKSAEGSDQSSFPPTAPEDKEQPKIPPKREQTKPEDKATSKPGVNNRTSEETKKKKVPTATLR